MSDQPLPLPQGTAAFVYNPLEIGDVRWYWLKIPFSLKGIYSTDVPHRAHLQRFCLVDSANLETAFRQRADELQRLWWEEHAELGPASPEKPLTENEAASKRWQDFLLGNDNSAQVGMLVRSGLYEVDLAKRRMTTCYWPADSHRVLRATWFVEKGSDWVPVKESLADELEEAYRSQIWNPELRHVKVHKQGLVAARVDLTTLTQESKGMYALFASESEMYLCKDDSYTWLSAKVKSNAPPGAKLRRGYKEPNQGSMEVDVKAEEVDNAGAQVPVTRLVLAVHGIGQNLIASNIAEDAGSMRNNIRQMTMEQLTEAERRSGRVEVLPVQWRKHLNLEVDALAKALMPPGVGSLRTMLHATAVEVLLYLTPLHCQDMLDSLATSLNATFDKFMRRNPGFQGTVSIVAHSLGSVLCFDILCNQPHLFEQLRVSSPIAADIHQSSAEGQAAARRSRAGGLAEEPELQAMGSADFEALAPGASNIPPFPPSATGVVDLVTPPRPAAGLSATVNNNDLIDLSRLTSPRTQAQRQSSGGLPTSEEQRLRAEIQRLQLDLEAARADRDRLASSLQSGSSAAASAADGSSYAAAWRAKFGSLAQTQERERLAPIVDIQALHFAVDQFVCIGSPLGLFLALRKVNPAKGQGLGMPAAVPLMLGGGYAGGDGLPAVRRMTNLYQPYDPVAYRLEPLIVSGADKRKPAYAPYYKGGKRLHIGMQEWSEDVGAAAAKASSALSQKVTGSLSYFMMGRVAKAAEAKVSEKHTEAREADAAAAGMRGEGSAEAEPADSAHDEELQNAAQVLNTAVWRITDGKTAAPVAGGSSAASKTASGRLDFDSPTANAWLSAISAHFGYWNDPDTALFVMRAVMGKDVLQSYAEVSVSESDAAKATSLLSPRILGK
ncbi:hypothetical protein WJX72_004107 [[Myrmecia] bisecta]|uniref:DDHD domain-containing protein n=1 Tax=[Myrmecia] bisecta TaxID=41462 RepID=A0AAW1P6V3_9CHLO